MKLKAAPQTKRLAFPLDLKAVSEAGEFEGYGSVFGTIDTYSDIVAPGAFKRSLAEDAAKGDMPAMLWQHDSREVIGAWAEMREDERGLYVRGQLALKTARGSETHELLKMKAVRGLSIGFQTIKSQWDETTKIRTLIDVDLWEVSVVTFAANPDAQVGAVKSIKTIREFEDWLRDAGGYSRADAKVIASRGFKAFAEQRDAATDGSAGALMASVRRLQAAMTP